MTLLYSLPALAGWEAKVVVSPNKIVYFSLADPTLNDLRFFTYDFDNHEIVRMEKQFRRDQCSWGRPSLDYQGKRIALEGTCQEDGAVDCSITPERCHYLLGIFDARSGQEIISLPHVDKQFSFSPDGTGIAFVEEHRGERGAPAPPGFVGGLFIYNFNTKAKIGVETLNVYPTDMTWSRHDGNVYFTNMASVAKYDVKKNETVLTPLHGIYFSPDGKYYVDLKDEPISRLYDSLENKELVELEKIVLDHPRNKSRDMSYSFWSDKLNSVVFRIGGETNIIFNPSTGKIIGEFEGEIVGVSPDGSLVAVCPSSEKRYGQIRVIDLMKLP